MGVPFYSVPAGMHPDRKILGLCQSVCVPRVVYYECFGVNKTALSEQAITRRHYHHSR